MVLSTVHKCECRAELILHSVSGYLTSCLAGHSVLGSRTMCCFFFFITKRSEHWCPTGCVLSPLLFSFYTNNCTSNIASVKLLKFADDATIIGLISDREESFYRNEVDRLVQWCVDNKLILNTSKTKELIS